MLEPCPHLLYTSRPPIELIIPTIMLPSWTSRITVGPHASQNLNSAEDVPSFPLALNSETCTGHQRRKTRCLHNLPILCFDFGAPSNRTPIPGPFRTLLYTADQSLIQTGPLDSDPKAHHVSARHSAYSDKPDYARCHLPAVTVPRHRI